MQSFVPLAAAVVAAPILKLCPQYFDWPILAFRRASRTWTMKSCLVRGRPSSEQNNGPWEGSSCLQTIKYSCHRTKISARPSNKGIDSLPERISFRLLDRDTHERRATGVVNRNISNTQVNARVVGAAGRNGELSRSQKRKHRQQAARISFVSHSPSRIASGRKRPILTGCTSG